MNNQNQNKQNPSNREKAMRDAAHIVLKNVRLSYCKLFEPEIGADGAPRYSVRVLVPKTDAGAKAKIDRAIQAATALAKLKHGNNFPANPNHSVHDGDGNRPSDNEPYGGENCGHWIFTASSKYQPTLLDSFKQPATEDDLYSGVYAHVGVTFFGYNAGMKKGIGVAINNVMKASDGERLGGSFYSADDDFGDIETPQGFSGDDLGGLW